MWPTICRGFGREEARKPGSKQGGVGGEGGRRLEVEFFVPHGSSYRSVLFLSAGDGAEIAFYGDRFDSDSSPPPRFRGIGGSFRIATTEFVRSFARTINGSGTTRAGNAVNCLYDAD